MAGAGGHGGRLGGPPVRWLGARRDLEVHRHADLAGLGLVQRVPAAGQLAAAQDVGGWDGDHAEQVVLAHVLVEHLEQDVSG